MHPLIRKLAFAVLSPAIMTRGPRGAVYLTFDDGPHPERTPKILEILARHHAKATFFMIGAEMEKYPALVAEVAAQGHAIGYHSHDHKHLSELSPREILGEIARMNRALTGQGAQPDLFRPPFGTLSLPGVVLYFLKGKKIVMWSLESRDSFATDAQAVIAKVQEAGVKDGEILLFHDDTAVTVEALPGVLQWLTAAGHRCAALG